eukprot:gb/GFBE01003656.1/.p1 GENE.gb/GFBE01003656.1/~~gb/GFBE01003656.1/.p1  ORF type:complete len:331 (+),score=77.60 gb/GFBE01003656.1/:1-993(+)
MPRLLPACVVVLGCTAIKQRTTPALPELHCKQQDQAPPMMSSRTGTPCLPEISVWPYKSNTEWSAALGERVVKAATPGSQVTEEVCQGFHLYGDSAWCLKAFQNEPSQLLGLSFGIEARDMWSETVSKMFKMPTKLFDCFQPPEKSPALAMTAKNAQGPCDDRSGPCYETHYEANRVCLGGKREVFQGRNYTTLTEQLAGRGSLSTHVKIDVEGSEWSVLEALLKNEDDMKKIRTLDMEIHFGFHIPQEELALAAVSMEDRVTREVKILEELAQKFAVTGSNVETNSVGWRPDRSCPQQQCEEPPVHTKGGFPVNQFAISFVNRAYLNSQ